jgi:hypothetical protein
VNLRYKLHGTSHSLRIKKNKLESSVNKFVIKSQVEIFLSAHMLHKKLLGDRFLEDN